MLNHRTALTFRLLLLPIAYYLLPVTSPRLSSSQGGIHDAIRSNGD
jgi:hypothetical protein